MISCPELTAAAGLSRERVGPAPATEADRRALAKTLKPLLDGPTWERPKPIMMGSIQDGMSFALSQMTAQARGEEPEPSAAEQERRDWWELRLTRRPWGWYRPGPRWTSLRLSRRRHQPCPLSRLRRRRLR